MIEQRDLLLVPFPFSDQSGAKVRPVIVISNNSFNSFSEDILVVGVTSNISSGRYSLPLSHQNLEEGILKISCTIKVENILKIEKELIVKKIGKIDETTFEKIVELLFSIIRYRELT